MTVKDLIQELKKCNPNTQVRVGTCCGTVDGVITEVSSDILSPSNRQPCVYVACEITHFNGQKVRRTYIADEKQFKEQSWCMNHLHRTSFKELQ